MNPIVRQVEKKNYIERAEDLRPGDTVQVSMKIFEGDKVRLQPFQGVVIQKSGTGLGRTFTVRKASGSVYVERVFPVHSPMIAEITIVRRGNIRRSKLYYLRKRTGKSTRIKESK